MIGRLLAVIMVIAAAGVHAQIWLEETVIDTAVVATNLDVPWDMQRWGEDTILFTERGGAIKRLAVNTGDVDLLYTAMDVAVEGQGGLMGIQLHPAFPQEPYCYAALTYSAGWIIKLRVDRLIYDVQADSFALDTTIISEIPSSISNIGGRMLIDDESKLLLTVGDAKNNDFPQDDSSLNGKVLRYNLDGTIPIDNPLENSPVYALGLRNSQGLAQAPSGIIYSSEHGPSSNDELNILDPGANYGWPLVSGYCNTSTQEICDSLSIHDPIEAWSPTIAPAGIEYFDQSIIPEWQNSILVASLKEKRLFVAELDENETAVVYTSWILSGVFGRIRDVLVMDDHLYLCTSNTDALGFPTDRDDVIVQLTPSKHTGIKEKPLVDIDVWAHDDLVHFSQPISATLEARDILGRILFRTELTDARSVHIPAHQRGVIFLSFGTEYNTKKIIR